MASACLTQDHEVQSRQRHLLLWDTGWLYLLFNPANLDKKEETWWSGVSHTRLKPWVRTGSNSVAMPVCFLHLWKELILGGASTEHTCCWLHLKASLLAPSHSSYEQTNMERSSSCVHAGELLKFPIWPLKKAPQSCLLGEKVVLCGNTLPQADQGGHGMLQCRHRLTKELWVEMTCFSATHLGFQGLCTWVQFFCFMSTWELISIPFPSRFYLAFQVPVLFLITSQALPHYPLYPSWWSLTAWCETLRRVADAWSELAPREKNVTQKLAAASHSLERTGTLLVLVPRSRRSGHIWAQAFESVQWVSQMGMLRLWGWQCQYHRTWKMSVCYSKIW